MSDLRHALRQLARSPVFTLLAVVSLAVPVRAAGLPADAEPAAPDRGRWIRSAGMPTARLFAGAAALHGKVYVIGGCVVRDGEVVPVNAVEAYDPKTGIWSSHAPLPTARSSFGIAVAATRFVSESVVMNPPPATTTLAPIPAKPPFTLRRRSGRFTLYATDADERALADVAEALQRHESQICRDLQCDYRRPVTVELFPDQAGLDRDERSRWMPGHYAHSDESGIQMISPRNPIPNLSVSYPTRVLIAVHEFAHLVNNAVNPRMPLWLNEGAAVFVAPHAPYAHVCLTSFPFDRVPPLRELEKSYRTVSAADLFAFSFVEFVVREHGLDVLNQLLRSPDSLERLLGATRQEIERRWGIYMEKHYAPAPPDRVRSHLNPILPEAPPAVFSRHPVLRGWRTQS